MKAWKTKKTTFWLACGCTAQSINCIISIRGERERELILRNNYEKIDCKKLYPINLN